MPLIRSASFNLFIEIFVRIALLSAFCYMTTMAPYVRVIQPADLEYSLKYPRHESFVPGHVLWSIVLAVPCVLSITAWAVCSDCNDALEFLLAWTLAMGMNGVTTNMVKLIVGRPRPDFFYRCFPDGIETMDLQCTGDPGEIMDGRKSFPSGHSSLSFCSLGLGSLWLCGRLRAVSRRRGGARLVLCAAPLALAACVALSRSCDYHHHWEDILVGSTLGYITAFICYRQYYNPLTSDLAGVPYIVSNTELAQYVNGTDSPSKERDENTPLLKKVDKWI
ncbi:phospholipid phosphatase 5 [Leguminivora glycinivorella]|uniref:phospholipid phosphatase 5 n=1 Tax=Leguminivora glycinivorella TaxID=1035111 RepID=UPI00200F4416|nr:phospholipid phosphatase 5 [Leguminivora glycinivorella]